MKLVKKYEFKIQSKEVFRNQHRLSSTRQRRQARSRITTIIVSQFVITQASSTATKANQDLSFKKSRHINLVILIKRTRSSTPRAATSRYATRSTAITTSRRSYLSKS